MRKLLDCNYRSCIDLHVHSTASDGILTPSAILDEALFLGIKALSITDHDTLEGSRIAMEAGIPSSLNFVSGLEMSAFPPSGFGISSGIHILGYGVEVENDDLCSYLRQLKKYREERAFKLFDRLDKLGIRLDKKVVFEEAAGGVVGRPHFARAMIRKGVVSSFEDAFDRFLAYGRPAYVKKRTAKIEDIFDLIKGAGGVPILAHPYMIDLKNNDLFEKFVVELKFMGLGGIEAIYPKHPNFKIDYYCNLARRLDLLITGGTDFHGGSDSNLKIGIGEGNFHVPFFIYDDLLAYLNKV